MQKLLIVGAALLAAFASLQGSSVANATQPINFTRGLVEGAGFTTNNPDSLAFGPDGRLYVADWWGRIQALTLDPNTKQVTARQQITKNSANDPGSYPVLLEVFGIAFDPCDGSLWVSNTISGFGDAGVESPPNFYSGKVTRLSGANFATVQDKITGLSVSNSGHQTNGLAFSSVADGCKLHIAQGSTTNAGVPMPSGLFQNQENPLSAAILVADVHAPSFNGAITYNENAYSLTVDQTGGDVGVYAPGFRNPYDLVFHSNGKFYVTDNGPNTGYGPGSTGCSTQATSDANGPDELNIVEQGRYYGHANRNRGLNIPDADQCIYHPSSDPSSGNYRAPVATIPSSSNGIVEYTASTFGGQMQGDLLYVDYNNWDLRRVQLSGDGSAVLSDTKLADDLESALDVTVGPDGTIYVAEWGQFFSAGRIAFFKPDETPVSSISVDNVSPLNGPVGGGQNITIAGTNFVDGETSVTIDGNPVTNLVVQNSTTITATTPAGALGTADVTVTVASIGSDTLLTGYNYVDGSSPQPPIADAGPDVVTPVAHPPHAHVTLDATGSSDPDGFITAWEWSVGGSVVSTSEIESVEFTEGVWIVKLTVTDNGGNIDTDEVRVTVTATPINPKPFWCFDPNLDTIVTSADLSLVAQAFGKKYPDPAYKRMRDYNGDRLIASADLSGVAQSFGSCPLLDRQINSATAAIEKYMDINQAFADGYVQVTQYIPGQGRHLVKSSLLDTTFDVTQPEGLLYEPDGNGGWRLGGPMYVMPKAQNPIVPAGFDTTEDAWHYHDALCFYPNGTVSLDDEATCTAQGGSYQTDVGWLLHLWNYWYNPSGRFVEVNTRF